MIRFFDPLIAGRILKEAGVIPPNCEDVDIVTTTVGKHKLRYTVVLPDEIVTKLQDAFLSGEKSR